MEKKIKFNLECYHQSCNCRSVRIGRRIRTERLHGLRRMTAGSFYQNYREVRLLVVHCSATRCDRNFPVEALHRCHLARGFASIGYHFYITRDGEVHICRPVHQIGAHATGWNDKSIGICYEGGLNEDGETADTRTYAQKCSLLYLLRQLKTDYPKAKILGHYQLSKSVHKACPCFDTKQEYREI